MLSDLLSQWQCCLDCYSDAHDDRCPITLLRLLIVQVVGREHTVQVRARGELGWEQGFMRAMVSKSEPESAPLPCAFSILIRSKLEPNIVFGLIEIRRKTHLYLCRCGFVPQISLPIYQISVCTCTYQISLQYIYIYMCVCAYLPPLIH